MTGLDGADSTAAEGADGGSAGDESPAHIWQSVGEIAVREALSDAAQLLACLQAAGAENLTG